MALDSQIQRASVYGLIMGLWNNVPAHAIDPRGLAEALNMRVDHMQLRTAKGYSTQIATPALGATSARGMEYATRSDGTADHLIAAAGSYWRGASNTPISLGPARGLIALADSASNVISGTSACRFTEDVSAGDAFYITADGQALRGTVSAVSTNNILSLNQNYGYQVSGGVAVASAGAFKTWDTQTDNPTSMVFWNDKWYFANSSDKLMQWDGSEFREVGLPPLSANEMTVAANENTGALSAGTRYYTFCWQDDAGDYGNAISSTQLTVTGSAGAARLTRSTLPNYPDWATKIRVYRGTTRDAKYYLASHTLSAIMGFSAAYFNLDDGSYEASISETELSPAENYQPPAALEHLEVYHDRLCGVKNQYFYCSGHLPTDIHSAMGGSLAGRYQPAVWRTTLRIGRGERNENNALVAFRGQFYILGSRTVWQVMGGSDNPDIWEIVSLLPNVGSESRWAIAPGGDKMFWVGRYNGRLTIFSFDARSVTPIGEAVQGCLSAADVSSLSAAAGGVGDGFYWLTFKTTGGYKTVEYNTDRGDGQGTWCERDWNMRRYARSETEIYAASASGVIWQLEDGYAASGADITRRIQTHAFDLGSKVNWKDYRHLFTEIEVISGAIPVSGLSGWARRDENAYAALAGYPISAAVGVRLEPTSLGTESGRRIQLKYSSVGTQDYIFRGVVIEGRLTEPDMNR